MKRILADDDNQESVDLEKEINDWLEHGEITNMRYDDYSDTDIATTAKHFYNLGRMAKKD